MDSSLWDNNGTKRQLDRRRVGEILIVPAPWTCARSPLTIWTYDLEDSEMARKSEASNDIMLVAPQSNIHWVSFVFDWVVEEHARDSKEFLHGMEG